MSQAKVIDCPKCKGAAVDITPLKKKDERIAVYGCQKCGYAFTADGKAFVENPEQLQDIFRGATMGNQAVIDMLLGTGEDVNPTTKALLVARMMEYGLQMYFDGVRQGILLGVLQNDFKRKGSPTEVGGTDGAGDGGKVHNTTRGVRPHSQSGSQPGGQ